MFVKKIIIILKQAQYVVTQQTRILLSAHTKEIIKKIKDLKNFKLIFSAHGLPEKNIKKGDPYQWQVEQSVKKIVENLNDENLRLDIELSKSSWTIKVDWTINRRL